MKRAAPPAPWRAEEFLKTVVPAIIESPAYEEGGLIAITSTQAPQVGEHADPSSCCVTPEYPNMPPPRKPKRRRGRSNQAAAAAASACC